jgi:hypothetical protein
MSSSPEGHGVQSTPIPASALDIHQANVAEEQERGHAAEGYPPAEDPHFTDQEWKEFQDDDIKAGGAVVCLMASIFSLGLLLYTTVAIIVNT